MTPQSSHVWSLACAGFLRSRALHGGRRRGPRRRGVWVPWRPPLVLGAGRKARNRARGPSPARGRPGPARATPPPGQRCPRCACAHSEPSVSPARQLGAGAHLSSPGRFSAPQVGFWRGRLANWWGQSLPGPPAGLRKGGPPGGLEWGGQFQKRFAGQVSENKGRGEDPACLWTCDSICFTRLFKGRPASLAKEEKELGGGGAGAQRFRPPAAGLH